jgi:hypothetical protein
MGAIAESSKHAKVFLVRRASMKMNCRMSLTSLRCFQTSTTASVRRLRTTRTSVSDLGTRQITNPSSLWTEWFPIRGLHSSAGVYWSELSRMNRLTFSLVTRHGSITRPPSGTGYVVPVLLALPLSNPLQNQS